MSGPLKAASISLGSSKRDKTSTVELLGREIVLERRGTDGDLEAFAKLFTELDGKVDALGVGGADIWLVVGKKKYAFKEILRLTSGAKKTPVLDGSGLKHTLERSAIQWLQDSGQVDFAQEKVLLVSAVDRFGMAQALAQACPSVVYGDLCFGLGVPIPVRKYKTVEALGHTLLPIVTRLPFKWFYPTGEKQEKRDPKMPGLFQEATLIAGDWHYIRRHAPDRLEGKKILTQTIRKADLDWLKTTGASLLITTTPIIQGETFATNVLEAALTAVEGVHPISEDRFGALIRQLGWVPELVPLG